MRATCLRVDSMKGVLREREKERERELRVARERENYNYRSPHGDFRFILLVRTRGGCASKDFSVLAEAFVTERWNLVRS